MTFRQPGNRTPRSRADPSLPVCTMRGANKTRTVALGAVQVPKEALALASRPLAVWARNQRAKTLLTHET